MQLQATIVSSCMNSILFGKIAGVLKQVESTGIRYRTKMMAVETFIQRKDLPKVKYITKLRKMAVCDILLQSRLRVSLSQLVTV